MVTKTAFPVAKARFQSLSFTLLSMTRLAAILVGKMVVSSCAYGCTNRQGKVGVKFYRFLTDTELKAKWVAAIKRENWTPKKHSRIRPIRSARFITGKCIICDS